MRGQIFIEVENKGAIESFINRCVNNGVMFTPERPMLGAQPVVRQDGSKALKLWLQGEFVEGHNVVPATSNNSEEDLLS